MSSHLSFAIEMTKVASNFDRPRGKRKSNGDQSKERPVAKKEEHFVRQTLPACMRKALSALV